MADSEAATDDSGQYSFTGLRAGTYSVEISGFDSNEVSFSSTSGAATVGVGESKVVSFDGTYLRTAGIMGRVSVEGEALGGVTVTLMGQGDDIPPATTDAGGLYSFSQLRSGDYTVAISGYDTDDYEFETTSKSVTIATGETANVPFDGTLLRTAGIAGRVSVGDMGLDGVTVTLAGAAEMTTMTANGGQYSFAGLAAGTYVLSITNPNPTAYNFAEDELQQTVMLEDDDSEIVNFEGTHTRTASVSGTLFIDEVMHDKMHNDGEPSVTVALAPLLAAGALDQKVVDGLLDKAKVKLRGPDLNTMQDIDINIDGTFSTGASLMAGSYQVELPVNDEDVMAGLAAAGVMFVGESMVVTVEAGGSATVNFPFRITMQTVSTGARMGAGETLGVGVPGVKLALYARADGTGMLGEATTDSTGMASFTFARDDNTGPAGNDNIVFVKAVESGHDALVVSGNEFVEFSYEGVERLSVADQNKEIATLVNVAVAFDFWVKSNEMARDGDEGLGGWNTQVYMGDPEADDAMPLMMVDEDGDTVNATMATDTTKGDNLGKSSFSYTVDPKMLPAMFTVMATEGAKAGQPDMGEAWEQSDALTLTHTGLDLPPGKDDDMHDLGPIRITFTTQAIYVGVHRELDDRTGYTDYIGLGDGDDRPGTAAQGEIEITLMAADSRGRLRTFKYDHDADPKTDDEDAVAKVGSSGMVSFKNIPADTEITVVADEGSGRVIVPDSRASREIDAFGDQLDDHPDGVIVGAFGDMSGARPDVWLCPLQRQTDDDPNKYCSTYAYKWDTGTISGTITNLRKGDKAKVTLTPVNSNDDYEDDLADDKTITSPGSSAKYSFTGVADGRYMVTLEANPGSWREVKKTGLSVMHNEKSTEDDYTGATSSGNDLAATDLRGVIRGRIGNDVNGSGGLTGRESRAGVEVAIYTAKKVGGSGTTKNNLVADKAVTDENDDPVMVETDGDGVFMFEGLQVGTSYFVKPQATEEYTAVRNGNPKIGKTAEKTTDVVPHALATAGLPPTASTPDPAIPSWDHLTSTLNDEGPNDFALLYKDGEAEGKATDPSVRAAHQHAVIELTRCRTVEDTDDATDGIQPGDECDDEAGEDEIEIDVGKDGSWEASGLMEGAYQVEIDEPSGYELVAEDGSSTGVTERQLIILKGSRADPEDAVETFYLKKRGSSDDTGTISFEADNVDCTSDSAVCVHSKDGSVDVTVSAEDDATIRLSPSNSNAKARGSVAVPNGDETTLSLSAGQLFGAFVHVTSESGYGSNASGDPPEVANTDRRYIRRNADARFDAVRITWRGDGLNLDRDDLNIDPDGETPPVNGVTDLTYTVDEGDGGNAVPAAATDVTFSVTGMGGDDNTIHFFALNGTGGCDPLSGGTFPTTAENGQTARTVSLIASVDGGDKGSAGICFVVGDRNSTTGADDLDRNDSNYFRYKFVLTRKN